MPSWWIVSSVILWFIVLAEGLAIIAILRALGGVHLQLETVQPSIRTLAEGDALEDLQLLSLGGKRFRLSEQWKSGRLALFVVSVNCVPCRDILRAFAGFYKNGLASGWNACVLCVGPELMVEYLIEDASLPTSVPVAAIEPEILMKQLRISSTPTIAVVDENGHALEVEVGNLSEARLIEIFRRWSAMAPPV